jgi:serine/threonine-protein kinase PknG
VYWYTGRSLIAQGKAREAVTAFERVDSILPGELAPKLAIALALEQTGNFTRAIEMFDLVSRIDPSYVSSIFGLARCLRAIGDRKGAVAALERVPQTSNLFVRAQVEIARTLISTDVSVPGVKELQDAAAVIETLTLEGKERYQLAKQVVETALHLIASRVLSPTSSTGILGQPLEERHLRRGLEKSLRAMAHLATGEEKIRLVDEANRVL